MREMGLDVTFLAKLGQRIASCVFHCAHHGGDGRPIDRRFHRVDGIASRPEHVAQIGALEPARAPFPPEESARRNRAMAAHDPRRLGSHRVNLRCAAGETEQQKNLVFTAAARSEISF